MQQFHLCATSGTQDLKPITPLISLFFSTPIDSGIAPIAVPEDAPHGDVIRLSLSLSTSAVFGAAIHSTISAFDASGRMYIIILYELEHLHYARYLDSSLPQIYRNVKMILGKYDSYARRPLNIAHI